MNDPALTARSTSAEPSLQSAEGEEPRKWWQSLWYQLRHFIHPPPDADVLREVVEELIDEPLSESGISPAERMLLVNIMELRERTVDDCMIPRADIIAADVTGTMEEVVDLMATHAHSRIPVYRGTLDDVIGMVHMKDIMPCVAYNRKRAIADLLRPVSFVAPSMPASKLLLQMRTTRQHMAMIVDEFGGIDGMVTIEDLVEQIVGKIEDEHDAPAGPPIITRTDGTLLVDARLPIDDFEQQTKIILPSLAEGEDIDTLGGYVAHMAGRVPAIGESFNHQDGMSFEVLEMDQSRIKRLRIRKDRPIEKPPASVPPRRQALGV